SYWSRSTTTQTDM
nr:Chain C, Protein Chica peptide [Drosophila melanogaster]